MRVLRNSIVALLASSIWASAARTQPAAALEPEPGPASFTLFVRGTPVGVEQVELNSSPDGWIIRSTGRFAPPLDVVIRRYETRYDAAWVPRELVLDSTRGGRPLALHTTFADGSATIELTQGSQKQTATAAVSERPLVLSNNVFGGYEALAIRLSASPPDNEFQVYIAPQGELTLRLNGVTEERIRIGNETVTVRRHRVTFLNPSGPLEAEIWSDGRHRLVRVSVPLAGIDFVRSDIGSVAARRQTITHPGDEETWIPASGFSLAATVTRPVNESEDRPPATRPPRWPAIVLVSGSRAQDRDEIVAGVPIFGQIASALADRGFLVVRYDRRGFGQSGGRAETSTVDVYAADVRGVFDYLERRKDVDKERIALVGHGDGAWVALFAAAKEDDIAAVALLGAGGTTGAELVLEQQQQALERLKAPEAEKQAKVELQKRIHRAVLGEGTWENVPSALRQQADTPWFRSLLTFDPGEVMEDVRQPVLIVHGSIDREVPPHHADKLAALAEARERRVPTDVVRLDGLNHLFVRAQTGETDEYSNLSSQPVSPDLVAAIADWLGQIYKPAGTGSSPGAPLGAGARPR